MRWRRVVGLVLVVALMACSGDDDEPGAAPTEDGPTTASTSAPPPTRAPGSPELNLVTYNLLHGITCPRDTDMCQAPDRLDIMGRHLEAAGCPDLVGLQEIHPRQAELMPDLVDRICGGRYQIAFEPTESPDQAMVLSARPIVDQAEIDLAAFPWEAYWVRIDTDLGPVDFLTAHFASSSNNPPCTAELCPPICPPGLPANECHARQVVQFLDQRADPPAALSVVAGDLNATPDDPTLATLDEARFADVWERVGIEPCDPDTEVGCTGASDQPPGPLQGLDTRAGFRFGSRIDFILVRSAPAIEPAFGLVEPFAGEPLDEPVDGLYWASDHVGVRAEVGATRL